MIVFNTWTFFIYFKLFQYFKDYFNGEIDPRVKYVKLTTF